MSNKPYCNSICKSNLSKICFPTVSAILLYSYLKIAVNCYDVENNSAIFRKYNMLNTQT